MSVPIDHGDGRPLGSGPARAGDEYPRMIRGDSVPDHFAALRRYNQMWSVAHFTH
jgi:hypothetical protein